MKRNEKRVFDLAARLFFFLFLFQHSLYGDAADSPDLSLEDHSLFATSSESKHPASPVSGNLFFLTDYRSRGISQTMCRPAVQGELKYTHSSGGYLRIWGSNVDGTSHFLNNTSLELDFYAGIERSIRKTDFKYDAGFEFYYYPGGRAPVRRRVLYDSVEIYFSLIYKSFNIRYSQTLTDFFGTNSSNPPQNWTENRSIRPNGSSVGSYYIEANYTVTPFPKWTVGFHAGYQGVINYKQLDYFDWWADAVYSFEPYEISLTYTIPKK